MSDSGISDYRDALIAQADPQPSATVLEEDARPRLGQSLGRTKQPELTVSPPPEVFMPAQPERARSVDEHYDDRCLGSPGQLHRPAARSAIAALEAIYGSIHQADQDVAIRSATNRRNTQIP